MILFERHLDWMLSVSPSVDVSVRGRFYAMKGEHPLFCSGPLVKVEDGLAVAMRPEWDGPGRVITTSPPEGYGA